LEVARRSATVECRPGPTVTTTRSSPVRAIETVGTIDG
jgi:hypothetical protein